MNHPWIALPLVALLTGCPKPPAPEGPIEAVSPEVLLTRALGEPAPGPATSSFDLRLDLPDQRINAQGALLVSPPDRFRIEVRGPIGPPQVVVVSDGKGIRTWLAGKNELYTADDADARIAAYTGGEAGMEALASLLLGRLPALGAPDLVRADSKPTYRWTGPGESHVDAALDPRTAHLVALALADEVGAPLLDAQVEGAQWPERLVAVLPQQGITATLEFKEWKAAEPSDAAFVLAAPPGAAVKPLLFKPSAGGDAALGDVKPPETPP
ncbi:MAG: hypothetical protein Q8P18_33880 [Pseudomonadota bacterium]|nr:hypothetical protein [Pseudomonadota bacterium]